MKGSRTKHSARFEAKVALEAIQGRESIAEIERRYKFHANVLYNWRGELVEKAARAFEARGDESRGTERESELLGKIGELMVERDFLSNGLGRLR